MDSTARMVSRRDMAASNRACIRQSDGFPLLSIPRPDSESAPAVACWTEDGPDFGGEEMMRLVAPLAVGPTIFALCFARGLAHLALALRRG